MPVTLDQIVAARRREVEHAKASTGRTELERRAQAHTPRGFRRALARAAETRPAIIAELKKASPSKGVIRGSFPVGRLAASLAAAGAAALSVLTEETHFQGSLAYLREASAATELPCLRKDFIVDEFQLLEARANSADAVLLIAASLTWAEMRALHGQARQLGLDVLVEVHDEAEMGRAAAIGADLIGVNCRNLHTFEVDLRVALELASKLPPCALRVAESGIQSVEDIRELRGAGYAAFLVGESLMRAEDPGTALRHLLAEAGAWPPLATAACAEPEAGTKKP
ncbi:MAG: indole-3-glycerol phosphate synthase TrpC [Candidatus Koribacter versatilis]|uniref:Indole-3-glycerol phosphate synthase n=1 Tax=Candidatus Korobacter versatilis TaxID=658062 RepID=A0A932A9W7_9BACT|nr:indole-3-glycerol phosphate synthase TrpC [Candidatus Koribacter versatilis]